MAVWLYFVLGAIVGSFLNVWGLRLNSGLSLGGRSRCNACGTTLRAFELIPILSFLFLRGRCRTCGTRLAWQYPLVEIFGGLVFVTVLSLDVTFLMKALMLLAFALYGVIAIYDVRHTIIPDKLVYAAAAAGLIVRFLSHGTLLDWLAGPLLFLFFAAFWYFSRGRAMGFGDAKLALAIGLLLGAATGFSAVVLAFWIGAALTLSVALGRALLWQRRGGRTIRGAEIPFAPFLVCGTWLALALNLDLLHVAFF